MTGIATLTAAATSQIFCHVALAGGTNGGLTLTPATVKEDFAADVLFGGSGQDWYLRNSLGTPTIFQDVVTDADMDSVFTEISTWL